MNSSFFGFEEIRMQQAENHVFSVFCAFFMFCLPSLASMQCLSYKGGGKKGYDIVLMRFSSGGTLL